MVDAVFGGAEDNARAFFASIVEIVERAEELHAAHHRHVPVEQDDVGTIDEAKSQRQLSIGRLIDANEQAFKDMSRALWNTISITDDPTKFRKSNKTTHEKTLE